MAEIPVERRGGIPWWAWLLGALLLIGLLYLLFRDDDPERVAVVSAPAVLVDPIAPVVSVTPVPVGSTTTTPANVPGTAATEPISDLLAIVGATDRASLVGRPVALTDVRVLDVVGDRTFFVGPDQSRRAFVVLNEVPTPNDPVEGRYDVETGQTVSIQGVMRRPDDPALKGQSIEGLPAGADVVIHAQSLNISRRP